MISPLTSHPKLILVPSPSHPSSWSHSLLSGSQRKLLFLAFTSLHMLSSLSGMFFHLLHMCKHATCLLNSSSCFRSQQKCHFILQSFWCPSIDETAQIIFSGQTAFFFVIIMYVYMCAFDYLIIIFLLPTRLSFHGERDY